MQNNFNIHGHVHNSIIENALRASVLISAEAGSNQNNSTRRVINTLQDSQERTKEALRRIEEENSALVLEAAAIESQISEIDVIHLKALREKTTELEITKERVLGLSQQLLTIESVSAAEGARVMAEHEVILQSRETEILEKIHSVIDNMMKKQEITLEEARQYMNGLSSQPGVRGGYDFSLNQIRNPIEGEFLVYQVIAALSCKHLAVELYEQMGLLNSSVQMQREIADFYQGDITKF